MSEHQRHDRHLPSTPKDIFESMIEAANRHDLEAMVTCFAPEYRGELREGAPTGKLCAQSATQMLTLQLLRHYASRGKDIATLETSHRLTP